MLTKTIDAEHLQILLALNGNQRIIDLEDEIAVNDKLSAIYVKHLWMAEGSSNAHWVEVIGNTYSVYQYARDILQSRWKFAERLICRCDTYGQLIEPDIMFAYSVNVIKDRWRSAETLLKNNRFWHDHYCTHWLITIEPDPTF